MKLAKKVTRFLHKFFCFAMKKFNIALNITLDLSDTKTISFYSICASLQPTRPGFKWAVKRENNLFLSY